MLEGVVRGALKQRIVIVVLAAIALGFGINATRRLSVDAFPDVTNIQVQVATEVPGRSPDEVERIVTVPGVRGFHRAVGNRGVERCRAGVVHTQPAGSGHGPEGGDSGRREAALPSGDD